MLDTARQRSETGAQKLSIFRFEFGGQIADRLPQFREKRLARSCFELSRRHAFERHHSRADDSKCQAHVCKTPVQECFVVIHHRLHETEDFVVVARIALHLDERNSSPRQYFLEYRPKATTGVQQSIESRRLLPAAAAKRSRADDV